MEFHEASNIFPLLTGQDFSDLVENIATYGLLQPIEVFEGKIIDGRNRYRACLEAGIVPRTIEISLAIDPYEYVWALNAERRHLPPGQKATSRLLQLQKSAEWQREQEAKREAANERRREATREQHSVSNPRGGECSGPVSRDTTPVVRERDTLAADTGTSTATAGRAQALVNKRPDLAERVAAGEMTLTNACQVAKKEALARSLPPPSGKYRVIYADPPWQYRDKLVDGYGPADNHFPPMSLSELCALSIPAEDNAVLFLWATSPMLEDALRVLNAWGFKYKASFIWDKIRHNYGHYNSVRHEFLLIGTRGNCTPDNSKLFDSVVSIERRKHSAKPAYFYEIIEALYQGNKIELFLRGKARHGWDGWGNEAK